MSELVSIPVKEGLQTELFLATKAVQEAKEAYEKALQRLADLMTVERIIKEFEDKGIEV